MTSAVERLPADDTPRAAAVPAHDLRVWLLLVDPLPNRVFFECGIVERLRSALPERLTAIFLVSEKHVLPWLERLGGVPRLQPEELLPARVPLRERVSRRVDIWLDERIGFYPLAVRQSLRFGFHRDRWAPNHSNWFLDPERAGPLPRWPWVERQMSRWHFSAHRYVPSELSRRMRAECDLLVVDNLQAHSSMPFLTAARRLGVPVVGYVASWDHTVGKGVVSPYLDRYVVQNEVMREDLVRYHGVEEDRIVVTGWPQTDVYKHVRSRGAYVSLLTGMNLDPARPVVMFAGNTPTNSPYEGNLVARLLSWWEENGARERFSLLFRPHPRDNRMPERFAIAKRHEGIAVQEPSYTDMDDLVTLLQNVDCVIANAGTILLDATINDRPCVCVLWDEGAPAGEEWAQLNLGGEHYRGLAESRAFYRAESFDELTSALDRALERPDELAVERRRVALEVVGEIDGRAAERVVDAILTLPAGDRTS